jgi:hypothetical protein
MTELHSLYHPDVSDALTAQRDAMTAANVAADGLRRRADALGIDADALVALLAIDDADALVDAMARYGITADTLRDAVRPMVDAMAAGSFDTVDAMLYRYDRERFDPTWSRPRLKTQHGTEVRGNRDRTYVIGSTNHPAGYRYCGTDYVRMAAPEILSRADLWLHMHDAAMPLIGTDTYSWSEVIHVKPFRPNDYMLTVGDAQNSSSDKPRKVRRTSVPRYWHRPDVVHYIGAWPMVGVRVVKRYRTTYNGAHVIGHGHWITTARKARATAVRKPRAATVTVDTVDALVVDAVAAMVAAAKDAPTATVSRRYELNGTKVTVAREPNHNRYRVEVTAADGTRKGTKVRTVDAVAAALRNRTR